MKSFVINAIKITSVQPRNIFTLEQKNISLNATQMCTNTMNRVKANGHSKSDKRSNHCKVSDGGKKSSYVKKDHL
jgi:hypothetical protein